MQAQQIEGLAQIADQYDAFLIDLWGVTHDGQKPFPGVLEVLRNLGKQGKKIIFLSNAPRRQAGARIRLADMGITETLYHDVVTSGEQAYQYLKRQVEEGKVQTAFHIGSNKDVSLFEDLPIEVTKEHLNVDLIVCSDRESWDQPEEAFDSVFDEAAKRNIPMLCANSDRLVMYQEKLAICAGFLAERYEAKGGKVTFFGKPHQQIYDAVRKILPGIDQGKILAIGDSMYTDVQGGKQAGLDVLFICGGIHMLELDIAWGQVSSKEKLKKLFEKYPLEPSFISAHLKW